MDEAGFTKGPWKASSFEQSFVARDDNSVWIYGTAGPNNPRIARVQFGLDYGQDIYAETVANANLIAAAPALYEALMTARVALIAVADSAVEAGFDKLADIIDDQLGKANAALSLARKGWK